MAVAVYILCALTSLACTILLARGYARTKARLLLWSSLCFLGLFANNIFLILDMIVFPTIDFSLGRGFSALIGLSLLLFGLVWETE